MTRFVDLTHGFYDGMPSYPADWFPQFVSERTMTPRPTRTAPSARSPTCVPAQRTHMEYRLHFFRGRRGHR